MPGLARPRASRRESQNLSRPSTQGWPVAVHSSGMTRNRSESVGSRHNSDTANPIAMQDVWSIDCRPPTEPPQTVHSERRLLLSGGMGRKQHTGVGAVESSGQLTSSPKSECGTASPCRTLCRRRPEDPSGPLPEIGLVLRRDGCAPRPRYAIHSLHRSRLRPLGPPRVVFCLVHKLRLVLAGWGHGFGSR